MKNDMTAEDEYAALLCDQQRILAGLRMKRHLNTIVGHPRSFLACRKGGRRAQEVCDGFLKDLFCFLPPSHLVYFAVFSFSFRSRATAFCTDLPSLSAENKHLHHFHHHHHPHLLHHHHHHYVIGLVMVLLFLPVVMVLLFWAVVGLMFGCPTMLRAIRFLEFPFSKWFIVVALVGCVIFCWVRYSSGHHLHLHHSSSSSSSSSSPSSSCPSSSSSSPPSSPSSSSSSSSSIIHHHLLSSFVVVTVVVRVCFMSSVLLCC